MSNEFDIGPLTWVKDEIDKSLNTVLDSLKKLSDNITETSHLRLAQTHAYQASGALDMVGLEGCKRFCSELEHCFSKLEKHEIICTPALIHQLIEAVEALKSYIEALMKGARDIPLRLYENLAPIVIAQGRELEKSELFFPDTSVPIPKDLPTLELSDEDYNKYISEQRVKYQKSFLNWLQTKQKESLDSMAEATLNVSQAQIRNVPKAMWWVASAFAESLLDADVAELSGAKRLCRRIDQELKLLQEGSAKANPQFLKDILYYVAISQVSIGNVPKVKDTYHLQNYIEHPSDQFTGGHIDQSEIETAHHLAEFLTTVSDIWNEISNKIDFNVGDRQNAMINIDNVLITKCADKLTEQQSLVQRLSQVVVVDLYSALSQAINFLRDGASTTTHPVLIEIAAGIHMLESSLRDYLELDADRIQKVLSEIQRLELIGSGAAYEQLEHDRTNELDADTIKAVVAHVHDSLKVIEQALDSFFRKPEEKSALLPTLKPLKEVASIFQMLNLEVPANVANVSLRFIEYFQSAQFSGNQGEFELLAESLSMLGMYAEGMPKVRPEYETAMEAALNRMQVVYTNIKPATETPAEHSEETKIASIEQNMADSDDDKKITDKAFDDELLDIYLTETEEVLAHIAENLQAIKVNANHESMVEVRRGFHTLKGSGRTVGLAGLGEVAGKVELFLNGLLDKKTHLTPDQLNEVEQVASAFAGWAEELRAHGQLVFNQEKWLARIEAWSNPPKVAKKKKAAEDFVLIGGVRQLSRQFYNIFLNESMLNITTLEQDLVKMSENTGMVAPSVKARHAIHTLASNALAAGFNPLGTLGRAVELWLDDVGDAWSLPQHKIYARVIKSIAKMWQSISEFNEPKEEKALLNAVAKVTPSICDTTRQQVETEIESVAPHAEELEHNVVESMTNATDSQNEAQDAPEMEPWTTEADVEVDGEILSLFHEEADDLLPLIGDELRAWKFDPKSTQHPDALQRALHTLKGSARMAGKNTLGSIVHHMEERVVQALKRKVDAQVFEHLFADLDLIGTYFDEGQLPEQPVVEPVVTHTETDVADLMPEPQDEVESAQDEIQAVEVNDHHQEEPRSTRAANRKTQYLRMRADVLDRLINEAGEISIIRSRIDKEVIGFKGTSHDLIESVTRLRNYLRELEIEADTQLQSRLTLLQETNEKFDPLEFDRFTRLQELTRMMAESVNDISTIQSGFVTNLGQAEAALQQQTRMNRDLQQALMSVRMLPFSQLSERMERVVRQTARDLNKRVDFVIEGAKTEIDRSVLDKIGAPLEHLLRNAVAHGIELPEVRKKSSKFETGRLRLKVSSSNDEIRIEISDDGAGVNLAKVKEIAIKNKIINADAEVSDQALMAVIFEPGFSTSTEVTQIAGRGVGLDVVRNEVTELGGRIDVESKVSEGTRFLIYLPITLTVAQVLMIRSGNTEYAISVAMIEQAQKIKQAELANAYSAGEVVWAGNHYPLHHIAKLLNEPIAENDQGYASILLLRSGNYRIALQVDEMLSNQEVVIKPIGAELARVPGIMGATVSGDGRVILILNPLLLANREVLAVGAVKVKVEEVQNVTHKLKALVVDDSLTMRKVLGRLLEREGFEVLVAKDGMDAMQLLQETVPDIILTDIEMPRMDGFGLSRNIRDDARTANTPLIMISSRTADKHQNLAQDIGVDAFFGKPVQDDELIAKVNALIASKKVLH